MSRAPGGYRLLLRLLPRWFRQRHGAEMEAIFAEHLEGRSRIGRLAAWVGACRDVLGMAVRLRARGRAADPSLRTTLDGLLQDLRFAARALRGAAGLLAPGPGGPRGSIRWRR